MNKDIFYQYDFYTLEQRYAENEIIEALDNEPALNENVGLFMQHVANFLFISIKENKNVETSNIAFPQIENDLRNALNGNSLYDDYFESNRENKLSEIVCNKFLSRIFIKDGYNDEEYIIQNHVHAWLEKKLSLQIVKDLRFNSVDILIRLIKKTEMLHHCFYVNLVKNIPQNWIKNNKEDWVNVNACPEHILDNIRTFDNEYFNNYINFHGSIDKANLWDYVCGATEGVDYVMLNDEYSFRSSVLLGCDVLLWIEFWDNLNLPIIQDCALHSYFNFNPKKHLELVNALVSKKIKVKSDLNILLFIIAKNYFEQSYRLTERLSFYEEEDRVNAKKEHIFNEGKKYYTEWQKKKSDYYNTLIKELRLQLSQSDIEDWIFSYKPIVNDHSYGSNELYNSEIKLLTNTYKFYFTQLTDFNLQRFNFQRFNFYVEIIRTLENKNLVAKLLNTMLNYIESDKFFWGQSYSEPYRSSINGIGYLIKLHPNPIQKAKEVIDRFKVNHQGWKPTNIDYKPIAKESFVYSGIASLFGQDVAFDSTPHEKDFFQDFLKTILIQDRYSQNDNSSYYQQPLRLLFWVSNNIFTDLKEYFEQELINNYDNLHSLLSILSCDNETLCSQSKSLLEDRLEKEFLIEKRQFNTRSQKNKVQEMEKMIELLKLK